MWCQCLHIGCIIGAGIIGACIIGAWHRRGNQAAFGAPPPNAVSCSEVHPHEGVRGKVVPRIPARGPRWNGTGRIAARAAERGPMRCGSSAAPGCDQTSGASMAGGVAPIVGPGRLPRRGGPWKRTCFTTLEFRFQRCEQGARRRWVPSPRSRPAWRRGSMAGGGTVRPMRRGRDNPPGRHAADYHEVGLDRPAFTSGAIAAPSVLRR